MLKICTKCHAEKDLDSFPKQANGKHGRMSICKVCRLEASKQWLSQNPERRRASAKRCYQRHRERNIAKTNAFNERNPEYKQRQHLKRSFNLSLEEFNMMRAQQDYRCAICGLHEEEHGKNLCVDHDHKTGRIRALLCSHCNRMIGFARERVDVLSAAIDYVRKYE